MGQLEGIAYFKGGKEMTERTKKNGKVRKRDGVYGGRERESYWRCEGLQRWETAEV